MKPIPYGRQHITDEDINAVVQSLKSDFLTQGPKISEFEEAFAAYVGCKYAVAVANGTAALHLSTMALNVRTGDRVITTPITFAASANCIRYCGGEVIFSDIDPETYLLDIKKVEEILAASPKGTYKGIIPVDFTGRAIDLEKFRVLADQYDLWIIEDACHAPGGYFINSIGDRQLCGNGIYADLAIFSFHPVKHIACGEGGMITTNDEKLYQRLLMLRSHGITRDSIKFVNDVYLASGLNANDQKVNEGTYPGWYMEMQELGYNYRLTDFQAALGLSQLTRSESGLKRRREIANRYFSAFTGKDFIYGQSGIVKGHAYHLYVVEIKNRLGLYNFLRAKNIFAQVHYVPCHLMPYYKGEGRREHSLKCAESYYKACLSLPIYPTLTCEEQDFIINTVEEFYSQ